MIVYYLSLIGVAVFAFSGGLAAGKKGLDWIGVLALASVTALGGGTVRDLLLNRGFIFWIKEPSYLWVILGTSIFTIVYVRFFTPPLKTLLIADALGLALFTIIGAQIAESYHMSNIVVVVMAILTGAAGGVMRDVLMGEIPLLFRSTETLYSVASILGVTVYLLLLELSDNKLLVSLIGIAVVAIIRFAAIFWEIKLPAFHIEKQTKKE